MMQLRRSARRARGSRANRNVALALVSGLVVLASCAPAPSTTPSTRGGDTPPTAPKQVAVVVRGDVPTLVPTVPGPVPGLAELDELLNVGLTTWGAGNQVLPRLAEDVPSTTNGLWKVLPNGRMETTWKIRQNARWHDGTRSEERRVGKECRL